MKRNYFSNLKKRKLRIDTQFINQSNVRHSQLFTGIAYISSTVALTKADEKCGKCDQKLVYTLMLSTVSTVRIFLQLIIN